MKYIDCLALLFLIIGGLNWGSVGLFGFNFVDFFFVGTMIDTAIYGVIGLAAFWKAYSCCKCCFG